MMAARKPRRLTLGGALLAAAALTLAACGSNGSGSGSSSGPLVIGALSSFTGSDAGYGPEVQAGCIPAANLVNKAGGVLGHKINCQSFNDASDPVDAVPATHQMLSSTPNLLFAIGVGSDTASAVVPIVNASDIPIFPSSGQSVFDKNSYPYYWRMVAIDVAQGYAMAAAAKSLPYQRVASVFANTTSAMGSQPGFVEGMHLLNEPVVDSLVLPSSAASYSSEVVALLRTHPQLIVGELDPSTAATFFTELRQLNGGKMLPVLGDEPESEVPWQKAVGGAIGKSTMDQYVRLVLPASPFSSAGFQTYVKALNASTVPDKQSYTTDVYSASYYDSVNIVCLAALEAKSVKPSVVNNYILGITNGVPGAVVVHNFADGKKLIDEGKKIRYVGASGPVFFPQYHNWQPPYNISQLTTNGSQTVLGLVSQSEVTHLLTIGTVNEK
jgi:ABC-type branched-subunit amino acid transport system substrate-binding protein